MNDTDDPIVATPYTLPAGSVLYSPCPTLDEALASWGDRFAQIEITGKPTPCHTHPEYIDNGYHPLGYYTQDAQYVSVRCRYSKRSQWLSEILVFAPITAWLIPCTRDGIVTGDPIQ